MACNMCSSGMQSQKWAALGYPRASWNPATWWKYHYLRGLSMRIQASMCICAKHEVGHYRNNANGVSMHSIVSSATNCEIMYRIAYLLESRRYRFERNCKICWYFI